MSDKNYLLSYEQFKIVLNKAIARQRQIQNETEI